jgi:uncharacterized membrane protein
MKNRSPAHIAYLVTIAVKGADGVIETLLGLLIALTGPDRFYSLVLRFTTPELESDPENKAAAAVQHGAAGLVHGSANFAIFFLLTHGILKSGIALNLLQDKRWIFPGGWSVSPCSIFSPWRW